MEAPGKSGLSTGYNGSGVEDPVSFFFVYLASNSVKYIEIRCEQPQDVWQTLFQESYIYKSLISLDQHPPLRKEETKKRLRAMPKICHLSSSPDSSLHSAIYRLSLHALSKWEATQNPKRKNTCMPNLILLEQHLRKKSVGSTKKKEERRHNYNRCGSAK